MFLFINSLTISRILLGPIIFFLITNLSMHWAALILFIFASITDYFDGYLARKYDKVSVLGEILDPIADKLLIVFLLFAISIFLSSEFIAFVSSVIIAREIWVGALRDFSARNQITNSTKVTFLAKLKTTIQLFSIIIYLLAIAANNMLLVVVADIVLFFALIITLYTGYLYTTSTFKNVTK